MADFDLQVKIFTDQLVDLLEQAKDEAGLQFASGLLCIHCNTALGSLGDNIDHIKQAIRYLGGLSHSYYRCPCHGHYEPHAAN